MQTKEDNDTTGLLVLAVLSAFIFLCVKGNGWLENHKIKGMMNRGEFEAVLESFPKSKFAKSAEDSIAKHLYSNCEFGQVIWRFRESVWFDSAVQRSADTLFRSGKYDEIVFGSNQFFYEQRSPDVYKAALNAIADSLLRNKKYADLQGFKYRDTEARRRMEESPHIMRELDKIDKQRKREDEKAAREWAQEALNRQTRMLESPTRFFANNPIKAGMTAMDVRSLIGQPDDINTTSVGGVYESQQWVYGGENYGMVLLYFDNGVLTSWQY